MIFRIERRLGLGLLVALCCAAGCGRVPDVVVKVVSVPPNSDGLKAALWQLQPKPEGGVEGRMGSPIPAFAYESTETDPNLRNFDFGLKIPDDEDVLYSVTVAAFRTYPRGRCLNGTTQAAQAADKDLNRGGISLPQELSLFFIMDPPGQLEPDIDGLCLSSLDDDAHPLLAGIHLTFDKMRRMGDGTTAVVSFTGWNFQPHARLEAALVPNMGDPMPTPLSAFTLEIVSPAEAALIGVPAPVALSLIGQRLSFVMVNPDGQRSLPYIAQLRVL